jgi:hypothetical protein
MINRANGHIGANINTLSNNNIGDGCIEDRAATVDKG